MLCWRDNLELNGLGSPVVESVVLPSPGFRCAFRPSKPEPLLVTSLPTLHLFSHVPGVQSVILSVMNLCVYFYQEHVCHDICLIHVGLPLPMQADVGGYQPVFIGSWQAEANTVTAGLAVRQPYSLHLGLQLEEGGTWTGPRPQEKGKGGKKAGDKGKGKDKAGKKGKT